ncbi:MAG: RnfABCDGE type electron transport complex subunit D [Eubacteriales bacterium]|nr:RnfABCDGE type electron transport complex subunit D [Eubacteriales bacterium]
MKKIPNVSSSPHFRSKLTTHGEMLDVIIAMIPITLWGAYHFGLRSLAVVAITVAASVLFEYLYEKAMHLPITINDLSAVVTGMILALNMPPQIPFWVPVIGAAFSIIVVKQLYGGLGQNFMNPALAGRCFLHISFAGLMTDFSCAKIGYDALTSATPLAQIENGTFDGTLLDLFLGNHAGTIGEVSVLCLLIGIVYMLYKNVITIQIPASYLITFAVFEFIAGGFNPTFVLMQLMSGGILFGACFMANDYVTSPVTHKGQILYGIFLGIMTGVIRTFAPSAEGVSYSILLGNLLVPIFERYTIPTAFGKGGSKK